MINKELKLQSGGVVQLVGTPASRRGRGFESRRSRHHRLGNYRTGFTEDTFIALTDCSSFEVWFSSSPSTL